MADYSAHFQEKVYTEINFKMFVKFKKQNVVCVHEFLWFAKKVVCNTYNVLGISAYIAGAIFVEHKYFSQI